MRLGCVVFLLVAAAAHATELRNIDAISHGEGVALSIRSSSQPALRIAVLKSPDRLVFDFRAAHVRKGQPLRLKGGGPVQQIRIAHWQKDNVRIVADLSSAARAQQSLRRLLDGSFTLRIDIQPRGAVAGLRNAAPTMESQSGDGRATPLAAQSVAHAPSAGRSLVIAVDAGHGGEDPGASGASGTKEKNVVLAIARALAREIDAQPGMRAVLTRDGDYFVPLRERMLRARRKQADLFVSIHADSIRNRAVSGASVYTLSARGASDEASRWLAERENAADLVGGVPLEDKNNVLKSVLLDLSQTASLSASQNAAARVLRSLEPLGSIRKRRVQQAGFVVLKSPDIPSMLVETAYISNPAEERRLADPGFQVKIAQAVCQGLREYFYSNPPPGTRMAQLVSQSRRTGG